jgi:circadian clock protein KaiC
MTAGRVRTGIPGLDEMLGGGFLPGDTIVVIGSAGTGKTILGLQYLVNGATQFNENGIYVTFEQMPDQIYRDALNFGWDLRRIEKENKLKIICTSPDLLLEGSKQEHLLDEPIMQIKPKRIVVDSLSHLELYVHGDDFRREAYRLTRYFKTKGLSCLLTWESHDVSGTSTLTESGLSFVADCVIPLRYVEIDSTMRKALAILKLRGSDHDKRLREFEITSEGIRVAKPFVGFEGIVTGSPRKMQTDNGKRSA